MTSSNAIAVRPVRSVLGFLASALLLAAPADAAVDARLLRYPDVSAESVTFAHAGDIWIAPREGGVAHRLSTPPGDEGLPRFSPDGRHVAFSGNYDGNLDAFVMPVEGGTPRRLTTHPANDRVLGWMPDGDSVLYASTMGTPTSRYTYLYTVPAEGGQPKKLAVPYGSFADVADDGRTVAYTPISTDFSTWKRYRGGLAGDIWTFDLRTLRSKNLTDHPASDSLPTWVGDDLYFVSDRGAAKRLNLWHVDPDTRRTRQVTSFTEYDVRFPAAGAGAIVFENGGTLWLLDAATERLREVPIEVVTDRASLRPERKNLADDIASATISPGGARVAFEARGEVFTVPREHGVVRNLTGTSGVAERHPAWSPDGRHVAVFSDATGEYELTLLPADGDGEARRVTSLGPGYRYMPQWSPDSKTIAFADQSMRLHLADVESGRVEEIDQGRFMMHGTLAGLRFAWSPDSRWVAWARAVDTTNRAIFVHDTETDRTHQVTSGFYNDVHPAFDPKGRYLYFLSNRDFSPAYSDVDNSFIYPNTTRVLAVPLRDDVPSPLAPRNDEVEVDDDDEDGGEDDGEDGDADEKKKKDVKDEEAIEIDFENFESRAVTLPMPSGNYRRLAAIDTHVLAHRAPRTGSVPGGRGIPDGESPLVGWNLEEREEETFVGDVNAFEISADGEKLLVGNEGKWHVIDAKPEQELKDALATHRLEATIDPREEWRQIFTDAWRFERDFFYDPNLHGVDWDLMRHRYGALVEEATTRSDVNWIIGELIGELSSSHAYRWGGDVEEAETVDVGFLGADLVMERGALRIDGILRGASWDVEDRSPLARPGLEIAEGDFIVAVNGTPVSAFDDPYSPFAGLAGATVELTVADRPRSKDTRRVLVETIPSESRLRYLAWVEDNRLAVEEMSGGRIGYIHVPDTGVGGQNELVRQFQGQFTKPGLIIDERFNGGGQIPDRFIELLNRPVLNYWAVRDGRDWRWPYATHVGPKAMLINEWAGSGGDAFPFYFRKAGLGPLIGKRTWGGLIGISGAPSLIDGGVATVPTFAIYSTDGEWIIENEGVHPDIEVIADPTLLAKGRDPQLEKAVDVVLEDLARNPPTEPARPPYPVR